MANSEKTNDLFKITGILTGCMHGTSKFDKEDKYHVSVKFDDGVRASLVDEVKKRKTYEKVSDGFIPDWFKKDDAQYINFKSGYDIKAVYLDNGNRVNSSIGDMLADFGSITGSKVVVALNIKDGAIYPVAISFKELKVTNACDFFDEDDLPF